MTGKHDSSLAATHTADTAWFTEARFGMFIHWGLYSLAARHEWVHTNEEIPADEYEKRYFNRFDPDLYDPRQWARMAREAGMKYFVITAKHHEGFCLWDSQHTDYKATNSPAGRDLLRPMVEAFREEGLKVGLYYSLIDWHHPQYTLDKYHPQRNDEKARQQNDDRDMAKYAEYLHAQVRELLTEFGKIDLAWFDFSFPGEDGKSKDDWQSEKLIKMIRQLQPGIIVNNRLDLPHKPDFVTPEQFVPFAAPVDDAGENPVWEQCHTFGGSWGYHRDEAGWKSVQQCIWMLVDSVSKGGNLLMNVGPNARGEFDPRVQDRLAGFGKWMKYNSRSIYGCTAAPADLPTPQDARMTYNPKTNRLYIHMINWPVRNLYLPGFGDRIEYAQLLHDSSELLIEYPKTQDAHCSLFDSNAPVSILLPTAKPDMEIPVIEVFLKD